MDTNALMRAAISVRELATGLTSRRPLTEVARKNLLVTRGVLVSALSKIEARLVSLDKASL